MVGRVGGDVFGDQLKATLAADGVDTTRVLTTEGEATGVASSRWKRVVRT